MLGYVSIFNVKPNLLLVFLVCLVPTLGKIFSAFIGFLIGLIFDILSGCVPGVHALLFMYVAIVCGLVAQLIKVRIYTVAVQTFFCSMLCNAIVLLFSVFCEKNMFNPWLISVMLIESLYNAVISIPIYLCLNRHHEVETL
jgi:rod shape-determining protein MreD